MKCGNEAFRVYRGRPSNITSGHKAIACEKRRRKCGIKFLHLRLGLRENRIWQFIENCWTWPILDQRRCQTLWFLHLKKFTATSFWLVKYCLLFNYYGFYLINWAIRIVIDVSLLLSEFFYTHNFSYFAICNTNLLTIIHISKYEIRVSCNFPIISKLFLIFVNIFKNSQFYYTLIRK